MFAGQKMIGVSAAKKRVRFKPIVVDIPHQLGSVEDRRRIQRGFAEFAAGVGRSSGSQVQQTGSPMRRLSRFAALGQAVSGVLRVHENLVRVEVVLLGILGVMGNAIHGKVEKQGQLLLGRK